MFDAKTMLWLIPACPALGSVLIALFGKAILKDRSHWPCILGAIGACVFSFLALFSLGADHDVHKVYYTWFQAGDVDVGMALRLDGLTAMMLVMVTFIGSFITIYCVGYMHHDPGYPRFFAAVSGFLFFMTGLVLADNFIVLYACWEGVGLCSYLLIGFWYEKPSAAAAARKAFLVTRLGDVGLFLGILTLWAHCGHSLEFDVVFQRAEHIDHGILIAACLLLFTGAVGKSAQFPLHVWLPDAMEGPSPVSALIHAATMVTAGVYLTARCTPLFTFAPEAQLVVACIGGFTALLAGLIALTQTDLKRVLAYSTVSQLGYMFLALGCGLRSQGLVSFAVVAAMFHLFTHAFFKALLFLGAGSVMHAMGGVIDMRKFSGLRKLMPTTHWTFLIGALALAGAPPLSGFWSKDEILSAARMASHEPTYGVIYLVLLIVGLVTAGLTAFYTFRAYFMTFWGEEKIPHEAGHHAHESPLVMTAPLMVLSIGAAAVGFVLGPMTHGFEHLLDHFWLHNPVVKPALGESHAHGMDLMMMLGSTIIGLSGIGLAYLLYVKNPSMPTSMAKGLVTAYELSRNKFYIDELYMAFIVKPLAWLANFFRVFDQYVIDSLVDVIAQIPRYLGILFRPIQNGLVQFYALLMALGIAGFLIAVLMR